MALDFPSNPVNGTTYNNYIWDSSVGAWLAQGSTNNVGDQIAGLQAKFPVSVANGGTGQTSLTSGRYLKGNGTSAVTLQAVPIPIADGGTGATTVAGARDSLGVGLVPIVAPTVNFSGGAATSNSLGEVSFSAVTSLSLNNVFTADYNAYKIVIAGLAGSTLNAAYDFRFRGGGTDRSATSYFQNGYQQLGANAPSIFQVSSFSSFQLGNLDTNAFGIFICEVLNPFESSVSFLSYDGHGYNGARQAVSSTGFYNVAQSQDGFTIYPRSGNATGTVKVWGYNI